MRRQQSNSYDDGAENPWRTLDGIRDGCRLTMDAARKCSSNFFLKGHKTPVDWLPDERWLNIAQR